METRLKKCMLTDEIFKLVHSVHQHMQILECAEKKNYIKSMTKLWTRNFRKWNKCAIFEDQRLCDWLGRGWARFFLE